VDAALKQVDAVLKAHPTSAIAKQGDEIKASVKDQIAMMKEMKAEEAKEAKEGEEPATPEKPAAPEQPATPEAK
jgi:hypothetical protein